MDKQIIWTKKAIKERAEIFEYWNYRNESKAYSTKLYKLFKQALKLIAKHSMIGKATQLENVRVKIVINFHLIYEITNFSIIVLSIWDTRRNPEKSEPEEK